MSKAKMFPFQPSHKHAAHMVSAKPCASSESPECMVISEKKFMRDHSLYSAMSSWLFAIAGATNIGVLGVLSAKILTAAEHNRPLFKMRNGIEPVMGNKKYNRIALAMVAFGGACMAVSNWLESKKVVTEWQLGAGKLQRKVNIVKNEQLQAQPAGQTQDTDMPAAQPRNWTASVQPKMADGADHVAALATSSQARSLG